MTFKKCIVSLKKMHLQAPSLYKRRSDKLDPHSVSQVHSLSQDLLQKVIYCWLVAMESFSKEPFSVDLGNGEKLFFYLCTTLDYKESGSIILKINKCRTCKENVAKIGGLFGPDGYALSFDRLQDAVGGYRQLEKMRERKNDSIDNYKVFIVSEKNLSKVPQRKGFDKVSGEPFYHLSLNLPHNVITKTPLAMRITKELMSKLYNGSMDSTLSKIITTLQESSEEYPRSDIELIKGTLEDPELLRKHMWYYRIKYVEDIQQFAKQFKCSVWNELSEAEKMQVRIYALFYNGNFTSDGNATNSIFESAKLVTDISSEADSMDTIISFMNSRTDPCTYMVQQVAEKVEKHGITSRFKVSLAWNTTTDLDAWIEIVGTNEWIGYSNLDSLDKNTRLDFDANASDPTTQPVENFSLSERRPGTYRLYVNNYYTRGLSRDNYIDFTVVINLDGEVNIIKDSWDVIKQGENQDSIAKGMMYIKTIEITQAMIDKKTAPKMSVKQANRFKHLKPQFLQKFGDVKSEIVNLDDIEEAMLLNYSEQRVATSTTTLHYLNQMALASGETLKLTKKRTRLGERVGGPQNFIKLLQNMKSGGSDITLCLRGRDYPPSYLTATNCSPNLKADIQANVYYEEGRAPRQPDFSATFDNCRFDSNWCEHYDCMKVIGILALKHSNYDGFFLAVENGRLPHINCNKWVVGGGMYPTDLNAEFHIYREIWQSHHTMIRPSYKGGKSLAIGVFLHKNREYPIIVNGKEIKIKV